VSGFSRYRVTSNGLYFRVEGWGRSLFGFGVPRWRPVALSTCSTYSQALQLLRYCEARDSYWTEVVPGPKPPPPPPPPDPRGDPGRA
jgi:hypothetical protein